MPGFFDRLGKAAQQTAAAAQKAAEEARVQLELRQVTGKFDEKAAELGKLVYRQQQGEEVSDADFLARISEMREIDAERARKEAELTGTRGPAVAAAPMTPQPATVTPAPVVPAPMAPAPAFATTAEPTVTDPELIVDTEAFENEGAPGAGAELVDAAAERRCECGALLKEGARFCAECGRPVTA